VNDYNPYAAPQESAPEAGPARTYWAGVPQAWSVGDVLGAAWTAFQAAWAPIFFAELLALFFQYIPDLLRGAANGADLVAEGSSGDTGWSAANTILGLFITAFLQVGLTRVHLKAARGERPEIGDLFRGGSRFRAMLGMNILANIGIAFGILLFIVPGIVFAIGLQLADLFIVDAEMGPVAAMGASWNVTKGHRLPLFGFDLLAVLLMATGALACGIGAIVALSVVRIAEAIIYLRITGRAPAAQPMGYGTSVVVS
jgi:hypothetical protein